MKKPALLNRREFGKIVAGATSAALIRSLWAKEAAPHAGGRYFYIALIADTHIIDPYYVKGSEHGTEDNESILQTTPRLMAARDLINSLHPEIEQVFVLGDYFHNYPSTDPDFYFKNTTRLDEAKKLTDGFHMPTHLVFGNHDYDVHHIPRSVSHQLFKAKFNAAPYSSLDYKGYKFIQLNNFLGSTQDRTATNFDPRIGSLGKEQLHWLQAELEQNKPTLLFVHYPLVLISPTEFGDFGLCLLLAKHREHVQMVVSGHLHRWINFADFYGPQHYGMAATRYDPNAYMLLELDTQQPGWRFLNIDLVEWSTHYSKPYHPA